MYKAKTGTYVWGAGGKKVREKQKGLGPAIYDKSKIT